jgi:tetratricopeptide (TPR) repeat protein
MQHTDVKTPEQPLTTQDKPNEPKPETKQAETKEVNGTQTTQSKTSESVKVLMSELTQENFSEGINRARKFKAEKNLEKCYDMLEAMIKKGVEMFGEYDVRLAMPYFRLGDVLIQKLEEQNDLFGDGIQEKAKGEKKEVMSDREEEIKVAWENMEIARVILEKYLDAKGLEMVHVKEKSLLLAEVFKRIGECENLKENFTKAREEFTKGIKILEGIEDNSSRRVLSENYFLLSNTISYEAKPGYAKEAKVYMEKAMAIMTTISQKEGIDEVEKKELKMVLDMMQKKKEDLEEEIKATNPADLEEIKKAISKTGNSTMTAFPKSQLQEKGKVNKLGTFGKGSEAQKKKLKEPATCVEVEKKAQEDASAKEVKKVQNSTETKEQAPLTT